MRKKIFIALIIVVIIFVIYRFGFLSIVYFTTPKDTALSPEEVSLFSGIKSMYKTSDIERAPRSLKLNTKDSGSYDLFIKSVDCNKSNDSLMHIGRNIAMMINKEINLASVFYEYKIVFYCNENSPITREYSFLRTDLDNVK